MTTDEWIAAAVKLRDTGTSISAIARRLGVGASSVTRALTRHDETTRSGVDHPPSEAVDEVAR